MSDSKLENHDKEDQKMKTTKWNIYEELKTEEDIQEFVEASITEAENDTDPSLLAHALGVAAVARSLGYHLALVPVQNR